MPEGGEQGGPIIPGRGSGSHHARGKGDRGAIMPEGGGQGGHHTGITLIMTLALSNRSP